MCPPPMVRSTTRGVFEGGCRYRLWSRWPAQDVGAERGRPSRRPSSSTSRLSLPPLGTSGLGALAEFDDARLLAWHAEPAPPAPNASRCASRTSTPESASTTSIHETQDRGVRAADDSVLSHSVVDVQGSACQAHRHVTCTPEASDAVVYEENHACGCFFGVSLTPSRVYVVIQTADLVTSEWALIAAAAPYREPRVVSTRRIGHEYRLNHQRDRFVIKTNDSHRTSGL